MSTDADTSAITETPERPDYAQYLVCAVMVAVGAYLVYDGVSLPGGYAKVDPVGPRFFPITIGVALLVMAVIATNSTTVRFVGVATNAGAVLTTSTLRLTVAVPRLVVPSFA